MMLDERPVSRRCGIPCNVSVTCLTLTMRMWPMLGISRGVRAKSGTSRCLTPLFSCLRLCSFAIGEMTPVFDHRTALLRRTIGWAERGLILCYWIICRMSRSTIQWTI